MPAFEARAETQSQFSRNVGDLVAVITGVPSVLGLTFLKPNFPRGEPQALIQDLIWERQFNFVVGGYSILQKLGLLNNPDQGGIEGAPIGPNAQIEMPPMWARDP
jgi:hypothetical protein